MNQRFVTSFVVVTGMLAAAVYFAGRAATHGGVVVTAVAVAAAVVGMLGFLALARVIVVVERGRRRR